MSKRENFEKLIRQYPVRPSETLYIGDSKQDVVIATSYGFKTVGPGLVWKPKVQSLICGR